MNMENIAGLVKLKSYRIEKQYEEFYTTGNLGVLMDSKIVHKDTSNLKKEYTKAWIKLLTNNLHNN